MKRCDKCKINPVKVAYDEKGDGLCWFCFYTSTYGKEHGTFLYESIYGKEGVKDEAR